MALHRRHPVLWFVLYVCLWFPSLAMAQTAADVARKVLPSVVLISTTDRNGQPLSIGSGFFVSNNQIVTNLHVVAGAQKGTAKLRGGNRPFVIDGSVATDEAHDLAIIQVTGTEGPSLLISSESNIQIGDQIYVAGNPEGLEGTFSQGIISAIRQLPTGPIIQITAPISPGSSGGPVLNQQGQVIGVAFATLRDGQNLNFALPSSHVRDLMQKAQGVQPLAALGSGSKAKESFLERTQGAVRAVNFKWTESIIQDDPHMTGMEKTTRELIRSSYTFVLRNLGDDDVKDVAYVLIFYGKDGLPFHSEVAIYKPPIMGHLAKFLEGGIFSKSNGGNNEPPVVSREVRKQTSKVEVRVLNYQIIR
jgi:hypothetical protein